jgi:Phage tail lysozyme
VALVSVPTPQVDVSKAPQSEVSSAAFARPNIGAGLEALGQGAEQLTDSLAKQQAQSDAQSMGVTLAADGSVQVATPKNSILLGQAGEDYHRVLADQLYASQQANVSQGLTNIQLQHQDDPTAAKVAMDAFVGNLRQSATSQLGAVAGNALADRAMGEASQRWANLAEKSFELNTRMGLQSIETQIDSANNWLTAAARQGAVDTDAYREKQADLSDAYDRLGSNKLYGYSADRIQAMKDRAFDLLQGEYVAGQIDDTFNKKGKAAALEAVRTQIDNNPNLDISEPDRNHLHNIAMSRLAYLSDEQQSAIAALKPTVELQKQKLASGNSGADAVTDREIDQTATQLSSLGAFKEAQDLQAAHMIADRMQAFKNLSPDQKSTVLMGAASAGVGGPIASALNTEQAGLQYYISKGWTPAQAAGIMGNLIHESGGRLNPAAVNPGDGTDGSDSIGIGQWNGQRAANLKSFAAAQGKSWQDFGVQLAFVQHELETSEGAAGQRLKAAQSPQDAAAAFALGYERPQGFQSGDLSKVTGGQNRLDQTLRLAGGGASTTPIGAGGVATVGRPFSDAEAQANPWLLPEYRARVQLDDASQVRLAKTQFEALDNAIKFTGSPSPEMLPQAAAALQIADRFPDQLGGEATKLRAALTGAPMGYAAGSSATASADMLSKANELARSGDPVGLLVAQNIKTSLDAGQKLFAKDQFEYGVGAEWLKRKPMPLDFSDPVKLQQSVAEHVAAATAISSKQGVGPVSAFTPAEAGQVKTIMAQAPADTQLAVLSAITNANMPEPVLKATLAGLGRDSTTAPLAWAGSLARDNPSAARDIIIGQSILQKEPKYAPKAEAMTAEIASAISHNDLPGEGQRAAMGQAVRATYAKMSADAGDTSGVINDGRMALAVEAATGGIRSYRGSNFVAPWYGASQDDTDAAIRSLTDKDFAGAQTADGKPFPVDMLKPSWSNMLTSNNWRLQSVGDGRYMVFSGKDEARQYLGSTTFVKGQPVPGGKFILDLGAKRDQVERASAGTASSTPFSDLPFAQVPVGGPM